MNDTGNYYVLQHLVLITGLTDRTLRSYISAGLLQGEKINGLWHFTPEQVENFLRHPAVRPSILTKNNSIVYDFLADGHKAAPEACVILDIPDADKKVVAKFFCDCINRSSSRGLRFSFDGVPAASRVILKGKAAEVLRLMNAYHRQFPTEE